MALQIVEGPEIEIGYVWTLEIELTVDEGEPVPFPDGVQLTSHVRGELDDPDPLVVLTLATGEIERIDDNNIRITIPEAGSSLLSPGTVFIDLTRTDVDPLGRYDMRLEVPASLPATRGLS